MDFVYAKYPKLLDPHSQKHYNHLRLLPRVHSAGESARSGDILYITLHLARYYFNIYQGLHLYVFNFQMFSTTLMALSSSICYIVAIAAGLIHGASPNTNIDSSISDCMNAGHRQADGAILKRAEEACISFLNSLFESKILTSQTHYLL